MKNYKYILFDLDGTLTDPKVGITKSVMYALKEMRDIDANTDELTHFIGPPLKDSFIKYYGFSGEDADKAVVYFRTYFKSKGIHENIIYDGIKDLLKALKAKGIELYVATSKPTVFAEIVIKNFDLQDYFTGVVGSNLDGTRTSKSEVIAAVLKEISQKGTDDILMIGDREYDINGAKAFDMDTVGVEYGYAKAGELESAGATYIVPTVKDLKHLLCN